MSNENQIIYLNNVRLSFPHLVEPQPKPDGGSSYNAEFIMPQAHPSFAQFMARVSAIAVTKWGEHATNILNLANQDRKKRCYGAGSEKINGKTFKPYDGYEGNVYITAGNSDRRPQIIKADGSAVDPDNAMEAQQLTRKMYGGCRVNVAVKPWLQDNKHGKAVRCELVAVQFAGDDTAFGEAATDASGMFGTVAIAEHNAPSPAGMPAFLGAPVAPQMPAAPFGAPAGLPSFLS